MLVGYEMIIANSYPLRTRGISIKYTSHPKTHTVAWPCTLYGIWSLAKASPLHGTAGGHPMRRPANPSLQGCLFASKTCDSLKPIPTLGRSLCQTAGLRWRPGQWRQTSRRQKRNDKDHFKRPPTAPVPVSIKTATQELGFWVTQEPVDTDALTIPSRDKDAFNSSRKLLHNYAIRSLPQLQTDRNTRVVMML